MLHILAHRCNIKIIVITVTECSRHATPKTRTQVAQTLRARKLPRMIVTVATKARQRMARARVLATLRLRTLRRPSMCVSLCVLNGVAKHGGVCFGLIFWSSVALCVCLVILTVYLVCGVCADKHRRCRASTMVDCLWLATCLHYKPSTAMPMCKVHANTHQHLALPHPPCSCGSADMRTRTV